MLLNLEKIRSDNVTNTLFEYTNKMANIIKYLDQDILNIIFENKKVLLDLKWNVQQTAFFDTGSTQYSENEIEYAREHPYIIHFSGATKPWQAGCLNPLWREYYRYLLKSPWRSSYYKIYCVMGKNKLIKIKNKLKYKIKEAISKNIK
jgi:lipopolysaccharide biosynthesis glycosyltransferase